MRLSEEQIARYAQEGFLMLEKVFTDEEVTLMREEMVKIIAEECPRRIMEKNGAVRSFFAPEYDNETFRRVERAKRLLQPAEQLVGNRVYIHQAKLNTKHAMVGDWWEWHQDFTFWKLDDGMPNPDVVTAMVYLNEINEFNGPLLLIPGSHKAGVIDPEGKTALTSVTEEDTRFRAYQASKPYLSALTADLKYTVAQQTVAEWAVKKGLYSAKGPAGSVLFFHGNILHASSNNLSPWDRHTLLVTYNNVANALSEVESPRPSFIANRNFTALICLEEA